MTDKRRLELTNILNCRDLGGYPSKYGTTQFGRFLRCGVVERPDESEINVLSNYNVKTVIDLRGNYECETTPTDFERIEGADVFHISLFEFNVADTDLFNMTIPQTYEFIVENYKAGVKQLLETIANAKDGAILYHCFFGKDRTGITSMLLLHIAGVSEEDIIADYQQSYTYLKPYIKAHSQTLWNPDNEKHFSLADTMEELLRFLKEKYGSLDNYLVSVGITEEIIKKIRKRFF